MKTRKYTILPLAGLAIATSPVDAATTLTGLGGGSGSAEVPADHGSNEAGTLNITLDWSTGGNWDQYPNWDGRGDVYQIQDSSGGSPAKIVFTPDAGFAATITSFDLDEWAGGGATTVDWIVSGGTSGTLASGTWDDFSIANGGRSTVTPNVTGADGEALTLSFGQTGGSSAYLAMDNLTFDQAAVPEPTTTALLGLGGLALILRRRK